MDPELTILIPTYNRANYLRIALKSVLLAASKADISIEILVSDNNSPDDTGEVIKELGDRRIHYLKRPRNIGPVLNVLQSVSLAKGKYICFLTDDDLLNPLAIVKIEKTISTYSSVGVIKSSFETIGPNNEEVIKKITYKDEDTLYPPGKEALLNLFLQTHIISGTVIRKDLIEHDGVLKYVQSLYPQMYWCGKALKKSFGFYSVYPLFRHRVGNEIYWKYSNDFMAKSIIEMIHDLTKDEPYGRKLAQKLIHTRIKLSIYPLILLKAQSMIRFVNKVVILARISEYRQDPLFWVYVFGLFILGARGFKAVWKVMQGFQATNR